ncbi:MAG TPA: cytochrome c [Kofleriaceae bacterium]|nr:cytochrome c [Kofleriaceae bacterium]
MTRPIPAALFASIVSILCACQPGDQPGPEYMPDMARGPGYKAFAPNEATRNGITLQRPVPGTIKRGYQPFHYGKGEAEAVRAGVELTDPFHPTPDVLAKGKLLYETYCLVCHGEQGKGDGPISSKIPPPPSYKSDRLMSYRPGRIFHVITMGANKMPSYAAQLTPDERWLVVTYVRAQLQELEEAMPGTGPAPDEPAPPASDTTPAAGAAPAGAAPAPAAAAAPAAPAAAAAPAAPAPAAGAPPKTDAAPATGSTPKTGAAPAAGSPPASGSTPAPAAGSGGRP